MEESQYRAHREIISYKSKKIIKQGHEIENGK